MKPVTGVWGVSRQEEPLIRAIEQLRRKGYHDLKTFSPIPSEGLLQGGPEAGKSPVRVYTLVGGIIGFISGLFLTIWTSLDWPLLTGGKPIASIPPFLVIVFELTILLGGLCALAGLVIHARLFRATPEAGYDPRFSEDRFGLFVRCEQLQAEEVRKLLEAAGAEETSTQYA